MSKYFKKGRRVQIRAQFCAKKENVPLKEWDSIFFRYSLKPLCANKNTLYPKGYKVFLLAQWEGFEPSSRVNGYTISNRARYDHFDTTASHKH